MIALLPQLRGHDVYRRRLIHVCPTGALHLRQRYQV